MSTTENRRFLGSIALTKLVHVKMTKKGKDGNPVDGIFIPFKQNDMVLGEVKEDKTQAVYMPFTVVLKPTRDDKGQDGFITKAIDSKTFKAFTDAEKEESKKRTPILGSFKDFSSGGGEADSAGDAGSGATFDADSDDDLPF